MSDQFGNIIYLLMLLVLVGGGFFVTGQGARNTRYLLIWSGVILAMVLGYRIYERFTFTPSLNDDGAYSMRVPFDQREGGYRVEFEANGHRIDGIIDTGATGIVLTYDDAKRAGIDVGLLGFSQEVSTANGITHIAPSTLDKLEFGDVYFDEVPVSIAQDGDLNRSLIGMSLLRQFQSFTVQNDTLLIEF